jgi:transposase
LSTKINALVDARGLPMRLTLTAGQRHDNRAVRALLKDLPADCDVLTDRAYHAQWIIDLITAAGSRPHIPTPRDRKIQHSVPLQIYGKRNLIERFFNKLKHFRRVATRYDKLARNYLAAVLLAATRLWTRFESTT